jgi:putative intracellular protease/amidase
MVYPGYTALDFIGPYEVLRHLAHAEVRFVWHEPGPIAADSGVLLLGATHSFDETPSPDIVLVPGGVTTFEHARDGKLLDWCARSTPRRPGRRRCALGRSSSPRQAC